MECTRARVVHGIIKPWCQNKATHTSSSASGEAGIAMRRSVEKRDAHRLPNFVSPCCRELNHQQTFTNTHSMNTTHSVRIQPSQTDRDREAQILLAACWCLVWFVISSFPSTSHTDEIHTNTHGLINIHYDTNTHAQKDARCIAPARSEGGLIRFRTPNHTEFGMAGRQLFSRTIVPPPPCRLHSWPNPTRTSHRTRVTHHIQLCVWSAG